MCFYCIACVSAEQPSVTLGGNYVDAPVLEVLEVYIKCDTTHITNAAVFCHIMFQWGDVRRPRARGTIPLHGMA